MTTQYFIEYLVASGIVILVLVGILLGIKKWREKFDDELDP